MASTVRSVPEPTVKPKQPRVSLFGQTVSLDFIASWGSHGDGVQTDDAKGSTAVAGLVSDRPSRRRREGREDRRPKRPWPSWGVRLLYAPLVAALELWGEKWDREK